MTRRSPPICVLPTLFLFAAMPATTLAVHRPASILDRVQLAKEVAKQPAREALAVAHLNAMRDTLGLGTRGGFRIRNAFTNGEGNTVIHLDQLYSGHRVWGLTAIAHVLADGSIRTFTDGLAPDISLSTEPRLDAEKAIAIALERLAARGPLAAQPTAELVVFPARFLDGLPELLDRRRLVDAKPNAPFVWAWEVKTRVHNDIDGLSELTYLVDARTGTLLRIDDDLEQVATPATGTGHGFYRGTVSIDTSQVTDGTYALYDTTRGTLPNPGFRNVTPDDSGWSPTGLQVWYDQHDATGMDTGQQFLFQSNPINDWGDGKPFTDWGNENGRNGQSAGVDAMSALQQAWDFYGHVFARNGFDGQGTTATAQVLATSSGSIDSSYWSPGGDEMYLGAGSYPGNPQGYQSLADLDIVSHELTHGVIDSTARFVDSPGYEEAAMSEGTCDFFAQMVLAWVSRSADAPDNQIPDTGATWQIGTNVGRGTPIRWMNKPSKDQRSVDAWYDGVGYLDGHFSSGVLNRALYFLARGASSHPGDDDYSEYLPGGMSGIGNDATARIWMNAVTERLHSANLASTSLTFDDVRSAALAAALELYPNDPDTIVAVESAFAAVNVGDPHGAAPHTQVIFASWRGKDWIDTRVGAWYSNRQIFARGEKVRPRVTVLNNPDTRVTWSVGGHSMFNGAGQLVQQGGRIDPDGSWQTPNSSGQYAITATSVADPREFAEGRALLINMDNDMDQEVDAIDMGRIALSWYLPQPLNLADSVSNSPGGVDDEDVAFFVDGMKSTWPAQ
jgi:Zn-dependent metalloprotease